jgi:hypothetical protein
LNEEAKSQREPSLKCEKPARGCRRQKDSCDKQATHKQKFLFYFPSNILEPRITSHNNSTVLKTHQHTAHSKTTSGAKEERRYI